MKKVEDVVEIGSLKRQGLSQRQIAHRLGISRPTVKKYLEDPEAVSRGRKPCERASKLDPYKEIIRVWLQEDLDYRATWIYDHLCPLGYTGSYDVVKRKVKGLKEERQRIAYLRFESEPGRQAQMDFGEFQVVCDDGTVKKYYLFSMILGYSRRIYGELVERCDLPTFLDCHIRAFSHYGGVPGEILYDRMRNVFLGKVAGKARFNDTLKGFAVHYGFKPEVTPAYAAWVKGKVERPFLFIREGFWRGYGFTSLERANDDLSAWLTAKDERVHGTTHEKVSERFERERPHLRALPVHAFDTSYRVYRKVHKDCTVRFECNSYVVPHTLVGKQILLRVKGRGMRVYEDEKLVVTYAIPEGKGHLVQDTRFYEALKRDVRMNARKYHYGCNSKGRAKATISPLKPRYALDVQVRPLQVYDSVAGGVQ
jgi:transposase